MINFDVEANELPWDEVLDCWVEQAEFEYAKAREQKSSEKKREQCRLALEHAYQTRKDALELHSELLTVADELAMGKPHPYLVYSRAAYDRGRVEFTKRSVYEWARARGREFPDLALSETLDCSSAEIPSPQSEIIGHQGKALSPSQKNKLAMAYIAADVLADLVDELSKKGHISPTGVPSCRKGDGTVNSRALSQFIASRTRRYRPAKPGEVEDVAVAYRGSELCEGAILAIIAIHLADLAEEARKSKWKVFRSSGGGEDPRSFMQAPGVYNSVLLYEHLQKERPTINDSRGFGDSSFQHKLNESKWYIKFDGVIKSEQLHKGMESAARGYKAVVGSILPSAS